MSKKLTRNTRDKMVAGVASGLADYFQLDASWLRVAFLLAIFFGGIGLWIYIILWIAVPERNNFFNYGDFQQGTGYENVFEKRKENKYNGSLIGGAVLVVLGFYFLLDEFNLIPYWFELDRLWPLALVAIGLVLIFRVAKRKEVIDSGVEAPEAGKPEEDEEHKEI